MKIVALITLLLFSINTFAGGDSKDVILLSLTETGDGDFELKYRDQKSSDVFTVYLSYDQERYLRKAKFLTSEKFYEAVDLLKRQLKLNGPVRFGSFGGGPCVVKKEENIYRSDALHIFEGGRVVYAFCQYS